MEKAIAGPMAGKELKKVPSSRTTWSHWKATHPDTTVLSTDTGYRRDYDLDPYEGYYRVAGLMFPVGDIRNDLPPKEMIVGVSILDGAKAYPLNLLKKRPGIFEDQVGGEPIKFTINAAGQVIEVSDSKGKAIPHIFAYWFAWQAFHPDTSVFKGD